MRYDYNYDRYRIWVKDIFNSDPLKSEKEEALLTAIDLFYSDATLMKIICAKTVTQIYNALTSARIA